MTPQHVSLDLPHFCTLLVFWSITVYFVLFSALTGVVLAAHLTPYDLKRLEMYSRNMVDYHLIMDMVPAVAKMFFLKQLSDISLSAAQSVSVLEFLSTSVHLHLRLYFISPTIFFPPGSPFRTWAAAQVYR